MLALIFLFVGVRSVQAIDAQVAVSAEFAPDSARVGEHVVLRVHTQVPEGYHLYSLTHIEDGPLRLRINVDGRAHGLQETGVWHAPAPAVEVDENFGKSVEYYDGKVTHSHGFQLAGQPGARQVPIRLKGQICNPKQCIPFRVATQAALSVQAGAARPEYASPAKLDGEAFPADRPAPVDTAAAGEHGVTGKAGASGDAPPLGEGFWSFVAIAFVAGLGALVTPCVFPMIPITVSFFSKFSQVSMRRSITMATIYAGSIVGTFTLVGVAVSLIFKAAGMQALSSSVGFNIFLAILLVVFAFNLFGLFEISVPNWLISKSSEKEFEYRQEDDGSLLHQAMGVFFMAVTFTLVSFTCTVGFIGVVLAQATKGSAFYPAIGMFFFSLAFSLPFFLLALFPKWADKLSGQGGDWMFAVKAVLGFIELAGAFKFISNVDLLWQSEVITRPVVLTAWVGIFLAAGLFLIRVINLPHSDPDTRTVGPLRMAVAIAMFSMAAFSWSGIRDTKSMGGWIDSWLPPAVYPGQAAAADHGDDGHLEWIVNDYPGAVARAKAENKPLFVDFTGYTCTNCRYMEGSMFPRPEIKAELEKMVRLSAYTDCDDQVCEDLGTMQRERFDTMALPFYAIIDARSETVLATHADMSRDPAQYRKFLADGIAAYKPTAAQPTQEAFPSDGPIVEMKFPRLDSGKEFALSSMRGRWVFLNYWASWCAPCKEELLHVFPEALAKAPHIQLVTVAFDGDDTKKSALAFAENAGLMQSTVLQGGDDMSDAGLEAALQPGDSLPVSFLINPEGRLVWKLDGSIDSETMNALLARTR